ncbi:hypothetical protein STVIR_1816 [Streptomyces viridochromogenes Tue57]|uniref:Uncharacterized protein n=1 Tax=Streptomyces viridochromogenes Tue57 TaxID=1160705 RepID=L8PLL1_STRVR|nr:hypothetical protein STVIR_1816 [Streptomyces viridochromogenes Tue57]
MRSPACPRVGCGTSRACLLPMRRHTGQADGITAGTVGGGRCPGRHAGENRGAWEPAAGSRAAALLGNEARGSWASPSPQSSPLIHGMD